MVYRTSVWLDRTQIFASWNERANDGAITGDTKAGTLVGIDRYGNKFFENMEEELPRTFYHPFFTESRRAVRN